jgi:hypothetical protein
MVCQQEELFKKARYRQEYTMRSGAVVAALLWWDLVLSAARELF